MAFPSDGWVQIFLGGIELACFHCIDKFGDKIPVMDSWFIASYSVGQNVVWVSTVDSQQFWTYFHPKWILNMLQKTRSPSLQTLLKPTWSCEIQYAAAIWNTHFSDYLQDLTRRCSIISVSTAWQQLSVVTSTGRPAWWSYSINVQPRLNSSTHLVMVAYDGPLSP